MAASHITLAVLKDPLGLAAYSPHTATQLPPDPCVGSPWKALQPTESLWGPHWALHCAYLGLVWKYAPVSYDLFLPFVCTHFLWGCWDNSFLWSFWSAKVFALNSAVNFKFETPKSRIDFFILSVFLLCHPFPEAISVGFGSTWLGREGWIEGMRVCQGMRTLAKILKYFSTKLLLYPFSIQFHPQGTEF